MIFVVCAAGGTTIIKMIRVLNTIFLSISYMVILNIPKKIHLTCKDKNNIDDPVWKKCLDKYKSMYSDYEIIIHDNEDIFWLSN